MSVLTDLEKAIFAEGKRLEALAREEVLKLRQTALVQELEKIEKELASILGGNKPAPAPAAKPVAKAAAKA